MALSATQLGDFRADIGDQGPTYAFTDDELQRLYSRAGTLPKATLLAYRQLLVNAAKFYKYVAGFTRQEQDQIFSNMLKTYELLKEELKAGDAVIIAGLEGVPTKNKEMSNA